MSMVKSCRINGTLVTQTTCIAWTSYNNISKQKDREILSIASNESFHQFTCCLFTSFSIPDNSFVCFWECGFILPWLYIYLTNSNIIYLWIFFTYSPNKAGCYLLAQQLSISPQSDVLWSTSRFVCLSRMGKRDLAQRRTHLHTSTGQKIRLFRWHVKWLSVTNVTWTVRVAGGWKLWFCCNGYHVFYIIPRHVEKFCLFSSIRF